ncbi:MAG: ATP-binding protein [Thermodesulfobacteriota bacterium]
MKLSLSNKLFSGFALLSLLTIFSGLTTFTIIEKMAESQRSIGLLQEFELTVHSLENATTIQDKASKISSESQGEFLANLDRAKELAAKILRFSACLPTHNASRPDESKSCQTVMLEAIDLYPKAAADYYERTLFVTNLIEKNRNIFKKMIEAADRLPQKAQKSMATAIINQLEMQKHEFEETNSHNSIAEMQSKNQELHGLDQGQDLAKLAQIFIDNTEQTYLNRLDLYKDKKLLGESTNRFRKTTRTIHQDIVENSLDNQQRIRILIVLMSLLSISLTLSFWLLSSRRLALFLSNQKEAITAIKSGDYDYAAETYATDEFGELCTFIKTLAIDLKKEINDREFSQQEQKDLQFQLMQAQRHESIGMLTGGIAHDFNNILTGITGYTDLALARLEDDHPVKKYLEIISQSGQRATEMTRKLLSFNQKQESGKQILDINTMISNLYKILNRMIGEDIILELETTPDLPTVMADPAQIEQILMNMAVNGKDAMPNGGILTIKTTTTSLDEPAVGHLEGVDPGDFIQISITDNGAGMTDAVKEKIFDPFFTTKASDRGTGLGLATVFDILKQHNGHVTVDSGVNKGTTFNFFLPAIDADLKIDARKITCDPCILRGQETILLVDDNDTARDFICETLEFCGYKLLTANCGNEAVKVMHQTDYKIDLLLTDVIMPEMNGQELAEITKKIYPTIKIIFMSGYDELPTGHELKTATPSGDFLKKPMSIETLSRKVRDVIDR